MSAPLLIEIGVEELPPKALRRLADAFCEQLRAGLAEASLEFSTSTGFASPRRLAIRVDDLPGVQPDRLEQRRGPAVKAAFDAEGEPTKAALGFARSCGVEVTDLGRIKTDQGEWLGIERSLKGQALSELIGDIIGRALNALPIPKRMRWGAGEVEFVRPVHWVVVLHGADVIDCEVLGLASNRLTRGHRFHHGQTITLNHADDYESQLENEGYVIPSFAKRRQRIVELVAAEREAIGGEAIVDPGLLDEVTALVEWPVIVAGSFDEDFLKLPEECLIASMQDHQKYFPVRAPDGALLNRFVTVSNIESSDPALVRSGNERVIRPRLADADFFYASDRNSSLASRQSNLQSVLFEKRLGSLAEKTTRVEALTRAIAPNCGVEGDIAARAAALSRCDLVSAMVGEFPELQGTMGGYYAEADGEDPAVCQALKEFYQPRFAGDDIASSAAGRCIAIADRIDTLIGIFGIGSAPTGDKDPFALRRAALGVLRSLTEAEIELDLLATLNTAFAGFAGIELAHDTVAQVFVFMTERLRGYYLDRGVPADVCAAVLATAPSSPREIAEKIRAVQSFRAMDAAVSLAAANKRIANILRKLDDADVPLWDGGVLVEASEKQLAEALTSRKPALEVLLAEANYTGYLERLAELQAPIDRFFDDVMVMSEDLTLRQNRIGLLSELYHLFTRVADIALLHE